MRVAASVNKPYGKWPASLGGVMVVELESFGKSFVASLTQAMTLEANATQLVDSAFAEAYRLGMINASVYNAVHSILGSTDSFVQPLIDLLSSFDPNAISLTSVTQYRYAELLSQSPFIFSLFLSSTNFCIYFFVPKTTTTTTIQRSIFQLYQKPARTYQRYHSLYQSSSHCTGL